MDLLFPLLLLLLLVATLRCVYRPGQTWNDHLIAGVVTASFAVYGVLGWGLRAVHGPTPGVAFGQAALLAGPLAISGLFHVLVSGPAPGRWWALAAASQPAGSFAFWGAALLVARLPFAWGAGQDPRWPGAWIALPLALAAWGTVFAFRPPSIRRFRVPVPGLAAPVRIVHLSDIHVGPNEPAPRVARLLARIPPLGADLVVMTGDFVTPFSAGAWQPVVEGLGRLGAPVATCLGNHDLPDREELGPALERAGVHHLVDRQVTVATPAGPVEVAGLDFRWTRAGPRAREVLAALPPGDAPLRVLLVHDPNRFADVPPGRFHLVLAGHLHGGPFALDFLGIRWSPLRLAGIPDRGLYRGNGTALHVHSGNIVVGYPPRLGTAPEIAVIEAVPA